MGIPLNQRGGPRGGEVREGGLGRGGGMRRVRYWWRLRIQEAQQTRIKDRSQRSREPRKQQHDYLIHHNHWRGGAIYEHKESERGCPREGERSFERNEDEVKDSNNGASRQYSVWWSHPDCVDILLAGQSVPQRQFELKHEEKILIFLV